MEYSLRSRTKPKEAKMPYSIRKKEKEEIKLINSTNKLGCRTRRLLSESEASQGAARSSGRKSSQSSRTLSSFGHAQTSSKKSSFRAEEESENDLQSYISTRSEEKTESNCSSRKSRRLMDINNLINSIDYNKIVLKKIQRNFPFVDVSRLNQFLDKEMKNVTSTVSVVEGYSLEREIRREREIGLVIDRLLNENIFREVKGSNLPLDSAQIACGRQEVKIHKVLNKYRRFDLHKEILQLNPDLDIKNADVCELTYLYSNMRKLQIKKIIKGWFFSQKTEAPQI
jgi:hypothetical protein